MKSRISASNIEDASQGKLINQIFSEKSEYSRIFYYAQVIKNVDPSNSNRIKVRIPVLDDIFYIDKAKEEGDATLPWCLPESVHFLETPENNQIVIVALFDPKIPYFGRMFFDSITGLSATDLFNKLSPEDQLLSNWLNADAALDINNPKPKKYNEFDTSNSTKFDVGVRGKGKNKLHFKDTTTLLTQNYEDTSNESHLELDTTSTLEAAVDLNLLSKQGVDERYHVLFDTKVFDYFEKQNAFYSKIIKLLLTKPAISPVGPCTGAPGAQDLVYQLKNLKADLKKLRAEGSSKKIVIN
jgi:hypothetical protein